MMNFLPPFIPRPGPSVDRVSVQLFGDIGLFYGRKPVNATTQRRDGRAGISQDPPGVDRRDKLRVHRRRIFDLDAQPDFSSGLDFKCVIGKPENTSPDFPPVICSDPLSSNHGTRSFWEQGIERMILFFIWRDDARSSSPQGQNI
jgi:hypothetical protein